MCVFHIFFPVQIPTFNAKYWSLYAGVSVLLSKWPGFYAEFIVWVRTCDHRPVRLLWEVGVVLRTKCVA